MLTQRQENILSRLIKQYVKTAEPVASAFLADFRDLGFSPATIRNELKDLDEKGFVRQPHPSAGRVPTNKGYRYFVDNLMEPAELTSEIAGQIRETIQRNKNREFSARIYPLLETAARITHSLGFAEITETDSFFTIGFSELTSQPEFEEKSNIIELAKVIDRLNKEAETFESMIEELDQCRIFIGNESPLCEENISLTAASAPAGSKNRIIIGLIGSTRINYPLQISIIKEIAKLLE